MVREGPNRLASEVSDWCSCPIGMHTWLAPFIGRCHVRVRTGTGLKRHTRLALFALVVFLPIISTLADSPDGEGLPRPLSSYSATSDASLWQILGERVRAEP